ncbi:Homoserine/homoserine lactone efflux protein [Marinobacterium sp. xm-d-420]|jgi:threonine/homoserine/homoserine lactone efflux protein|uniref:LysE family translocator n=1 Tax=Marinobacterium sp. xm-d-420 TaxID=2497737 RepID=UPI00156A59ED|nr:LysE family translocator [Marinobacterium sp. xm-d-420]NRP28585.1 Homoserine/homoserine lactone efflux protein [Marinobacterium sp. xm-d-420]
MTLESSLSFFLAVLVFGVTPGPGVFAILARALVSGSRSCLFLALGMTISDILYLIAACIGLAALATHWGEVFTVIRVVGAVYLIYLGWKMWNAPLDLDSVDSDSSTSGGLLSFVQGFLISASNPKVILFYIAFLPTFMDLNALDSSDVALAAFLTLIALMIGLMGIAVFAAKARKFFKSELSVKRLNRSAGSIMVAAGAYLVSRN